MKRTIKFNGQEKEIFSPKQPTPKKGQVWVNRITRQKQLIYKISDDKTQAYFENEERQRFSLGFGWLDGRNYYYDGYVL